MCLHEKPFELETSEDITKVFRNEEMEDEEMEFMDGTWKKEINTWEELVGNNLLNQEAVIEGAVHSIRNMGDVAFIILRRREGLFQTVYENEMANVSIHELKEAMTIRVKGILHEEERAPHGRELRIRHIDILSTPAEPLPMAIEHISGSKIKLQTDFPEKHSGAFQI